MTFLFRTSAIALAALVITALPMVAVTAQQPPTRNEAAADAPLEAPADPLVSEQAALERIEGYLNSIDSLQGRFVQTTSRGTRAEGDFSLLRPGRIRFDYDSPEPTLLVADGMNFVIYDRELERATMVPLTRTPLWLLLREDIELDDGLDILNVHQDGEYLAVLVRQSDSPEDGTIELVFRRDPLELRLWEVVDAQGVRTQVALHELDYETRPSLRDFNVQNLPGIRPRGFDRNN